MHQSTSKRHVAARKAKSPGSRRKSGIKPPIWVRATGKRKTREKKARYYLSKTAWAPHTVEERQIALFVVTCNLRLYHQLPINLSVGMVMVYFSPRCLDKDGNPFPWKQEEVVAKYRMAGVAGLYPTLGVSDPKAKQKVAVRNLVNEVKTFIKRRTAVDGCCSPLDLRNAFIVFRGGVEINPTAFGRAVFAATGIRTATPFGKRVYKGFHILETGSGLAKKCRKVDNAA